MIHSGRIPDPGIDPTRPHVGENLGNEINPFTLRKCDSLDFTSIQVEQGKSVRKLARRKDVCIPWETRECSKRSL